MKTCQMKTFNLATLIIGVLLFCTIDMHAQSGNSSLNQPELMKKFIGTWKGEVGKDTIVIGVNNPFGPGLDCTSEIITRGKTLNSVRQLYGYDIKNDKFIIAELIKSSPSIELCAIWFISKNAGEMVLLQDISNPENAILEWRFEFKSPDTIVQTALKNNKVYKVVTVTRVK
jgi:hypothetical protein